MEKWRDATGKHPAMQQIGDIGKSLISVGHSWFEKKIALLTSKAYHGGKNLFKKRGRLTFDLH